MEHVIVIGISQTARYFTDSRFSSSEEQAKSLYEIYEMTTGHTLLLRDAL